MNRESEFREALTRELARWSGVSATFGRRSKHPALFLTVGGRERVFTFPGTPGDRRSVLNQVRDLRRALRDLGAEAVV